MNMVREFLKYTIPSTIGMVIISLYVVVDGIFVSRGVSVEALAALTVAMPFTMAINAFSTIFSMGGGTLVSIYMGKGEKEKAVNLFRQSVYILLILGVIFGGLSIIFIKKIMYLLGTSAALEGYVYDYLVYYLIFIVPVVMQGILLTFLRNDGAPKFAMNIRIIGALLNVLLDYIFIFHFKMGIKGAAIASGTGQTVSFIIGMWYFLSKKGELSFGIVKFSGAEIKRIIQIGLPTFFTAISYSVIILFSNGIIIKSFGEIGMAAYGIINYVLAISYYAILGICNGIQPLISFYYGAKKYEFVKKVYKMGVFSNVLVCIIFFVGCIFIGKDISYVFTSDSKIINLAYIALNAANFSYIIMSVNLTDITFFQSIDKPIYSNIICLGRGIVYILLGLYLLPVIMGDYGVWYAMIFSEGMTLLTTIIVFRKIKNVFNLKEYSFS